MDFLTVPYTEASNSLLRARLDDFARKNNEKVMLQQIEWAAYWRELVNVSVHRQGADVAEIGSTWVEPLVAMNVLAPFSREEIQLLGGEKSFFPALWQNVTHEDSQNAWGIPARIDMRMIYYWQDMFDAAGVEPMQAFSSAEAMKHAFYKLQSRVQYPWALPTARFSPNLVHNTASWIWEAGGDFIAADGKKFLVNMEKSRRGIQNHYELIEFMSPECRACSQELVLELFAARKIAATIAGPWLIQYLQGIGLTPALFALVGVASPPGPPFVGGTVYIRWKHSRKMDLAWKLICELSGRDFNLAFSKASEWLPSHQDVWTDEFINQNRFYSEYYKGIQNGRGLRPVRLWGMIEDRLSQALGDIWDDLFTLSNDARSGSLERIIAKHLEPMAVRIETILNG